MSRIDTRGAEEARSQLPDLLDAAERGHATVITRRGRAVAEIVPVGTARAREKPLLRLAGSGRGLWGVQAGRTLARVRDEWDR